MFIVRRQLTSKGARSFSALVSSSVNNGVATIKLQSPPVNAMSRELLQGLCSTLATVEADKSAKAAILTSATDGIFCAGINIAELATTDSAKLTAFWTAVQDTFFALYGFKKPIVAAINGSAPAGGCWMSTLCDGRIMASGKTVIGLNETQLGIVAPYWFADPFKAAVGQRNAELHLQLGSLLPATKALEIGLVDELVEIGQVRRSNPPHLLTHMSLEPCPRSKIPL